MHGAIQQGSAKPTYERLGACSQYLFGPASRNQLPQRGPEGPEGAGGGGGFRGDADKRCLPAAAPAPAPPQRVEPEDIGLTIPGRLGVDTRPDIITRRTTKRYKYDITDISLDSTFQAKEKLKQVGGGHKRLLLLHAPNTHAVRTGSGCKRSALEAEDML